MAVEAVNGLLVATRRLATPPKAIDPQNYFGRMRWLQDRAVLPALADINSTIELGALPWDCCPGQRSWFASDLLGASTTLSVGIRADATLNAGAGYAGADNVLVSAQSAAAAFAISGLAGVGIEKAGFRLWQIAGLSECPPGNRLAHLYATLKGAASSAGGDVAWEYQFALD